MSWDQTRYLTDRNLYDITLNIGDDSIPIKIRKIPWSRRNQIIASAMRYDTQGNMTWDLDYYNRECLKAMIAEAPWGATTDIFLTQINEELGAALEQLIPRPTGISTSVRTPEQIKKG